MYKKKELVRKIVKNSEDTMKLTIKETEIIYDLVINSIIECIQESEDGLDLRGLVQFQKVDETRLTYRNPQTGETVCKEPHKKIKLKLSKIIKDSI